MPQLTPRRRNQVAGMLAANMGVCEIARCDGGSDFQGLDARHAAVKEILTDAHKQARFVFAQKYADFWKTVVFSDEKTFSSCTKGPITVHRPRNSRSDPMYVKESGGSGRFSIHVWG
ncbi:hypothetical protein J437_LFUL015838 [Ladona fulva]|uniref:Transposase n=1 Tax=Ladona fulva TaxID=123851 RepID=A0A8K0KK81_LADFU|nr:hypothetical protein J437_LFUL015838 [Ladona fulva]